MCELMTCVKGGGKSKLKSPFENLWKPLWLCNPELGIFTQVSTHSALNVHVPQSDQRCIFFLTINPSDIFRLDQKQIHISKSQS